MKRGAGVIAGLVLMAAAVRVVGGADGEGEGVPEVRVRIARFADDRPAAISYTFDDNLREQYTVALPMLNEVGFKGTFFVIAGKTAETPEEGAKKQVDPNVRGKWGGISWPELKKMADEGQEIGSHTLSGTLDRKIYDVPLTVVVEAAGATSAVARRGGKAQPVRVAKGAVYVQAAPGADAIAVSWKQ
jgi:hypothetical protein